MMCRRNVGASYATVRARCNLQPAILSSFVLVPVDFSQFRTGKNRNLRFRYHIYLYTFFGKSHSIL